MRLAFLFLILVGCAKGYSVIEVAGVDTCQNGQAPVHTPRYACKNIHGIFVSDNTLAICEDRESCNHLCLAAAMAEMRAER